LAQGYQDPLLSLSDWDAREKDAVICLGTNK
jgi:hypothetical protein